MELQGKIIATSETKSGTSAKGDWHKREFVIETHDQYPRRMAFQMFADENTLNQPQIGHEVTVTFSINAREYNGKWYNDINATNINIINAG